MKDTDHSMNIYLIQQTTPFLFTIVTMIKLKNIISSFHAEKGYGPNSIDNTILKLLKDEISGLLTEYLIFHF